MKEEKKDQYCIALVLSKQHCLWEHWVTRHSNALWTDLRQSAWHLLSPGPGWCSWCRCRCPHLLLSRFWWSDSPYSPQTWWQRNCREMIRFLFLFHGATESSTECLMSHRTSRPAALCCLWATSRLDRGLGRVWLYTRTRRSFHSVPPCTLAAWGFGWALGD